MRRNFLAVWRRRDLSLSRDHGAPRLWTRRVQIFRLPIARCSRFTARVALPAARQYREPLERADGDRPALSCGAHRVSEAMPCRRPDAADAAAAAVWPGRLQLLASGCVRRTRVPAAGRVPAVATG